MHPFAILVYTLYTVFQYTVYSVCYIYIQYTSIYCKNKTNHLSVCISNTILCTHTIHQHNIATRQKKNSEKQPRVEFIIMGFFYGFPKWMSTDIFWNWTRLTGVTTLRVVVCCIRIVETGHSKTNLLLLLNNGLKNSLRTFSTPRGWVSRRNNHPGGCEFIQF